MKKYLLVFIFLFQNLALAENSFVEYFGMGMIIQSYESICEEQGKTPIETSSKQICEIVTKDKLCANVPQDELQKCDELDSFGLTDYWAYTAGCINGSFDSISDTLSFFWETMKWAWSNGTSSEARDKSADATNEFLDSAKLFLHTEYQKAYAQATPPTQKIVALSKMGNAIGKLIFEAVSAEVSKNYKELACMNNRARQARLCKVYSDIFVPPVAALALLKSGPKAVEQFPNLAKIANAANPSLFAKMADQFPAITKTLESIDGTIQTNKMISHPKEIPFNLTNGFRPVSAETMIKRADELEPEMRASITGAYNALNNPETLKAYYKDLYKETVEWMAKKGNPKDMELLKSGKISRHALSVVVVKRMKARGDTGFTTLVKTKEGGKLSYGAQNIKLDEVVTENDAFRAAVRTGPFIDRNFNDNVRKGHGIFSHMIQRDIVHSALVKETNGNPKKFYEFLGTKKGINWWTDIFDSTNTSMNRPENITEYVNHKMMVQDDSFELSFEK